MDAETAAERNRSRPVPSKVPHQVIERMTAKFEPPNPSLHHWEKHTATIDAKIIRGLRIHSICEDDNNGDEDVKLVGDPNTIPWDLIARAWLDPLPDPLLKEGESKRRREQQRQQMMINSESVAHQTDLMARRVVAEAMKEAAARWSLEKKKKEKEEDKGPPHTLDMSEVGKEMAAVKKQFLEGLKGTSSLGDVLPIIAAQEHLVAEGCVADLKAADLEKLLEETFRKRCRALLHRFFPPPPSL